MIDWGQVGPANSPTPTTPTTTAPVAPASPGGLSAIVPTPMGATGGSQTGPKTFSQTTQAEVDAMSPFDRLRRGLSGILPNAEGKAEGIDTLGQNLFGRGNGSPLGGIPLFGDIIGGVGNVAHGMVNALVVKPIESFAAGIARVPTGRLPGGADENFNAIGEWSRVNDPAVYKQWKIIDAAASNDVLMGGNLKNDFNVEVSQLYDDQLYESRLGHTPVLATGPAGSLGGMLSQAIQGFLGLASNASQSVLGSMGLFDPGGTSNTYEEMKQVFDNPGMAQYDQSNLAIGLTDEAKKAFEDLAAGKITEQQARDRIAIASKGGRSRLEESAVRYNAGLEVSETEKRAVEAWQSGAWSADHAKDYIVSHGQGITRNFVGQLVGSVVTDPLVLATIGAGAISSVGKIGVKVAGNAGLDVVETARGAGIAGRLGLTGIREKLAVGAKNSSELAKMAISSDNAFEKMALTVASVQKNPVLGPVSRIMRGLIDPFGVYRPSTVARATTDLMDVNALQAFGYVYGAYPGGPLYEVQAIGREFGMTSELKSAIGAYVKDQENLMMAKVEQHTLLQSAFAEQALVGDIPVDYAIEPMVRNASPDARTQLVDHMMKVKKVTFTASEDYDLAGRMSVSFGNDIPYWEKRLATMSPDTKSAFHAVTYKMPEKEFEAAKATINLADYDGELPLGNMVLSSAETLDDVIAKDIIGNIKAILKNENEPQRIAAATAQWNAQARQYPKIDSIGYATGGQEQVEKLVKELERRVENGNITKRVLNSELNHPALRPIRDMLDRNSVPTNGMLTPAEIVAQRSVAASDAALAIQKLGFSEVTVERFFARITQAQKVVKSNGRKVGETVSRYSKKEYRNMHMWLTADGKTGFAIKPDGDLVSVFNVGEKGLIQKIVKHFDALGGTKGNAFDEGRLVELYAQGGQKEVARVPWSPQDAPKGWTGGTPDKVYMETPSHATRAIQPHTPFVQLGESEQARITKRLTDKGWTISGDVATDPTGKAMTMDEVIGYDAQYITRLAEHDAQLQAYEAAKAKQAADASLGKGASNLGDQLPNLPVKPRSRFSTHPDLLPDVPATKRLWNVGFRPDEEVAWGMKRDVATGMPMVDRDPTISHVVDGVPGRQLFSDTTRNFLGQIVGKSNAEHLNKPIDALEAFINTQRDVITGQRLVMNISQRFERSTFDAGIPKSISHDIFRAASDVAGLDRTTIRGINPTNLWTSIQDIIPRNLVLKDGTKLDIHIVMDHLLQASGGDIRIMGISSGFTQRARNVLRKMGDSSNVSGQLTVTQYNKVRYAFNPTFIIQRVTDAPYYSILYGNMPVGARALSGENAVLKAITDNLVRTGTARYFSMDMTEYATFSNFTEGISTAFHQAGIKDQMLARIHDAPDTIIANNMTNMLHARLGDIFAGSIENITKTAEKDPELAAEMLQAGKNLTNSIADWRRVYSNNAGRLLNDNEVGLRYFQDQLNAWRRHVVNPDGTLDFSQLIAEGERFQPTDIGAITGIQPEILAQKELGYADSAALRADVAGSIKKINGEFMLVKGEHDIPWLEETLRSIGASPEYIKRASAYYGNTWDGFWYNLSRPVESGGLDISPHFAKEAQAVIAREAQSRGMDPWEYLSGVMQINIGPESLDTAMGRFVSFLKGGPGDASMGDWGSFYRSHLDPSAQQTLVEEWGRTSGKVVSNIPVPDGFTVNPHIAASGTVSTELPRDGIFHVTTAADAVKAEGFSGSTAGGMLRPAGAKDEVFGFGSKGDTQNAGRISILTNRARAQTYKDRLTMVVKAARGEIPEGDVLDYFTPLYEKAFGSAQRDQMMASVAGPLAAGATTPEDVMALAVRLDKGLVGGNLEAADRSVGFYGTFEKAKAVDPGQISMLNLATSDKPGVSQVGKDAGELTFLPKDLHVLGTGTSDIKEFFDTGIEKMLAKRVAEGPNSNADVEAAIQQIAKLTQSTLKGTPAEGMTRTQLRDLVNAIPIDQASPYNRSQHLAISLFKSKIRDAQDDIFRLAEMQTKRTVLERSLNHPLFGLYPASYMWGKVLPETVKFLAKNPYAATYGIADVQRSIAIQREYDPELDRTMGGVDNSAGAFLLDYLTPGLPWSDHAARMSPLVRGILNGKDIGAIWRAELSTVSPQRWVQQVVETMNEVGPAMDYLSTPTSPEVQGLQQITSGASAPTAGAPGEQPQITGPTKASALGPILMDDMTRLSSILLQGQSAEE